MTRRLGRWIAAHDWELFGYFLLICAIMQTLFYCLCGYGIYLVVAKCLGHPL